MTSAPTSWISRSPREKHLLSSDYLHAWIGERGNQNQSSNSVVIRTEPEDVVAMAWRVFARFGCDRPCKEPISVPDSISSFAGPNRARRTPSSAAIAHRGLTGLSLRLMLFIQLPPRTAPRSQESEVGFSFVLHQSELAAQYRHAGRLDEARLTADRILAFANLFVKRYP